MEIKIVRSKRRLRTVTARLHNGVLLINAPLLLSDERLGVIVANFKSKFEKKELKENLDKEHNLTAMASLLNEKYFGNKLKVKSIEYVTTQNSRFACCNYRTARIRISHKIGLMPKWVRKYIIVHELAHLIEPNHSKAFWDIVSQYRLAERARGYLMAVSMV
jgi:predicted metal-dependent hydrolase